MIKVLILLVFCTQLFLADVHDRATPGCVFDAVGRDPNSSPLLVSLQGTFMNPIAPQDLRISIKHNETLWIACPGGNFTSTSIVIDSKGELVACDVGDKLLVQGHSTSYGSIKCNLDESTRPSLLKTSYNEGCEMGGTLADIGYRLPLGAFPVYTVCQSSKYSLSFYVKYSITRWANALRGHTPSSNIKAFDEAIKQLYERSHTTAVLKEMGYSDDHFLEEGPLAAPNDFFYPFQRDATSCYHNIAPQWHSFKVGNWAAVQKATTTLVQRAAQGDFIAYAGTLGVAMLENKNNGELDYLYLDEHKGHPVPKWFWKLIYSSQNHSGNIIFGYNNPYISSKDDVDDEFRSAICATDHFPTVTWLTGVNNSDPTLGYIYACVFHEVIDAGLYDIVTKFVLPSEDRFIGSLQFN